MDYLKSINDKFGHDEGDLAIKSGAEILSTVFQGVGVIGRLGGDEFAAVAVVENGQMADDLLYDAKKNRKLCNSTGETKNNMGD